jgi:ABC transporter, substrate-binding protein, family 1
MLPTLQRNNMQVGAGGDAVAYQYVFETLLFQFGGQLYRDDRSATALDSVEALEAFKMWTGLYTEYSLPLTYDIYSYFRSGSIPLFIADYTQYNLISAAAPELKGKWVMAPIPGIRQEDGSIRRLASSSGTAGVLLKAAEDKESAFQFLNWLTTEETQTRYSVDLESAMGIAARYNSANRETMKNIGWSKSEYEALSAMWENVRDFPILPSNYYISRNINNAFRAVVHRDENPRETLSKYAGIIDKEITRKNRDLGIGGEAS